MKKNLKQYRSHKFDLLVNFLVLLLLPALLFCIFGIVFCIFVYFVGDVNFYDEKRLNKKCKALGEMIFLLLHCIVALWPLLLPATALLLLCSLCASAALPPCCARACGRKGCHIRHARPPNSIPYIVLYCY